METALIDQLVAHCQSAKFTGILRMRAHEGIGEVWFLSGVADEVHFGVSTGDEAMGRMRQATDVTFELVARLPHPGGGFKTRFPAKGSVATATPVTLMRYCEQYALTCTLAVESRGVLVEATYELGDLVSVETTADDDGVTAMLEAQEGTYEFTLPRVELPAGTPVLPPSSLKESMPPPEPASVRAILDAKPAGGRAASDEAEVKRKTVEIARQKKASTSKMRAVEPVAAPPPEDKREAEKREAEKREAEKREAEKRAAEKREAEKRAAEKRAAEKREAEKREAEKREAEKRAAEKREAEKLEAEKREAEKLEAEKREAEKREAEKREAEKLEAEKREAEKLEAEKREEEEREEEEEAPAKEDESPEPAAARDEPEAEEAPPAAAMAAPKTPWTWVVVPLLLLAALAYLAWSTRF